MRIQAGQLKEFEGSYRALFESAGDAILIMNRQRFIQCNVMSLKMFGCKSRADIVGRTYWEFSPLRQPDGRESKVKAQKAFRAALKGVPQRFTWKHCRKDGTPFDTEVSLSSIRSGGRKYIQAIVRDASEHARATEALHEKEKEIDRFFANALDLLCIADTDGYFRRVNREWETTLGYPIAELEGKQFLDYVHPEDLDGTLQAVSELGRQKEVLNFVNRYRCKDGSYRWIEWRSFPAGKLIYAAARDITERREKEEAFQNQANEFRWLMKSMANAFVVWGTIFDRDGKLVDIRFEYFNDAYERISGLKLSDVQGKTVREVWPSTEQSWFDVYGDVARSGEPRSFEMHHSPTRGLYACNAYRPWHTSDRLCCVFQDITELRRATNALRENEERLRFAFEGTTDGMWDWDVVTGQAHFSQRYYTMLGYDRDEFPGSYAAWRDLLHPDDVKATEEILQASLKTHAPFAVEFRMRSKAGEWKWILSRGKVAETDANGNVIRVAGSHADITERKLAEQALEMFRYTVDQASDEVVWIRKDAGFEYVNEQACRMLGYTREELMQLCLFDIDPYFPRERWEEDWKNFQRERQGGTVLVESFQRRKSGELFPVDVTAKHLWLGERELHVAVVRDITERKQAERALREREEHFRLFMNHFPGLAYIKDSDGRILFANEGFRTAVDIAPEGIIGKTNADAFPAEFADKMTRDDRRVLESGESDEIEEQFGDQIWSTHKFVLPQIGGPPLLGGFTLNISERKLAEESLRKSETFLNTVFEYSPYSMWVSDRDGTMLRMNQACRDLLHVTDEELVGRYNIFDDNIVEQQGAIPLVKRVFEDRQRVRFKLTYDSSQFRSIPLADTTQLILQVSISPVLDARGSVIHAIIQHEDITELTRAEQALRTSRDLLHTIIDTAPIAIAALDLEGKVHTVWNKTAERMLGWTAEEAMGRFLPSVPPEGTEEFRGFRETIRSGKILNGVEVRRRKRDGSPTEYSIYASPLHDAQGNISGNIAVLVDINERKRAETELRESEARYRLLFEQNPLPTLIYGLDGLLVLAVNDVFAATYGYTKAEALALHLVDLYPESERRGITELIPTLHGHAYSGEMHHLKKDGTQITVEVHSDDMPYGGRAARIAVITDITERKRVAVALQKSEELYRTVFRNTGTATVLIEEDTIISLANPQFEALSGYSRKEIEGKKSWTEFVFRDDLDRMRAQHQLRRDRQEAALKEYEFRFVAGDGAIRNILLTIDVIPGTKKSIASLLDITERKRAEQALEMFRFTVDQASDEVVWLNREGGFEYVNEQACRMLGYTREELMHLRLWDIDPTFPKQQWERDWEFFRHGNERASISLESAQRRKSGEMFPVDVRVKQLRFGERDLHVVVVRDITERRRADQALRESEFLLRKSQDVGDLGSYYFDVPTGTWITSAKLDEVLGIDSEYPKSIEGWTDLVHPDDKQTMVHHLTDDVLARHGRFDKEYRIIRHKDRQERWVHGLGELVFDESGNPTKMIGTIQDVTERNRAETEIRRLNRELEHRVAERTAQLEAANKELEAFAYSISHDLRAPLRAIDGYARILVEDYQASLDNEGKRVCAVINEEVRRMGTLIDDLLTFSRLGRSHMVQVVIDQTVLAGTVFHELAAPDVRSRIDFRLPQIPPSPGDPRLMRQVWTNILSNAIKFSSRRERPAIEVRGDVSGDEIVYSVTDNGAGFDMQYAGKLFGVFQRLHSTSEFEGTGVGLAIVQRIIHRHGGRVWAEGRPDHGATFYFSVPLKGSSS